MRRIGIVVMAGAVVVAGCRMREADELAERDGARAEEDGAQGAPPVLEDRTGAADARLAEKRRQKEVGGLLATLRAWQEENSGKRAICSGPEADRVAVATRRLGELRSREAVPLLVELTVFRYRPPHYWPEGGRGGPGLPWEERCPAVGALREIGRDAVPGILQRLGDHDPWRTPEESIPLVQALMRIVGGEEETVTFLKKASLEADTEPVRDNLEKAAGLAQLEP